VKVRTIGAEHIILKRLQESGTGRLFHNELNWHGMLAFSSASLQRCLEKGLVDRDPRDISVKGMYYITDQGKMVLERLEEVQPMDLDMDRSDDRLFLDRWSETDEPEQWKKWGYKVRDGKVLHRFHYTVPPAGYKYLTFELERNPYWMDHFQDVRW
jgi:hypothetical protein